jgi:hypothetical protein
MALLANGKIATSNEARQYIDPAAPVSLRDARALVRAHDAWYAEQLNTMTLGQLNAYITRQDEELRLAATQYVLYERPSYAKHIHTRTEGNLEARMAVAEERLGCAHLARRILTGELS